MRICSPVQCYIINATQYSHIRPVSSSQSLPTNPSHGQLCNREKMFVHAYSHDSHTQSRLSRGIDVGGHYHIARTSIVVIHRRICIGFTFGQESRSPHFVLRRRMASSSCSFLGSGRNQGLVEAGPRFLQSRQLDRRRIAGCSGSIYSNP